MATAISLPANQIAEPNLKQRLARAERVNKLKSQALILPLLLFVLLTFLAPIASLLWRSVENPEVVNTLPRTLASDADLRALARNSGLWVISHLIWRRYARPRLDAARMLEVPFGPFERQRSDLGFH